jgi:hypothetical protein
LKIGCYDKLIDSLTKNELNKVLENIEYEADTDVSINSQKYVVEIDIVENEVDFNVLTIIEYKQRYGEERYSLD